MQENAAALHLRHTVVRRYKVARATAGPAAQTLLGRLRRSPISGRLRTRTGLRDAQERLERTRPGTSEMILRHAVEGAHNDFWIIAVYQIDNLAVSSTATTFQKTSANEPVCKRPKAIVRGRRILDAGMYLAERRAAARINYEQQIALTGWRKVELGW